MGMTQHELNLTLEQKRLASLVDIRYELDRPYGRSRLEGVRVVLYYQDGVDPAARALREAIEVDERRSVDKRRDLQVRQFGYRSVHLVARLGERLREPSLHEFSNMWFEIQVRSILEHAWAEIEHEICYKSGVLFPDVVLRRFGALAGTLELLEAQFSNLRGARDELVTRWRAVYEHDGDPDVTLDAARLIALLEVLRPGGLGWRTALKAGSPFATRTEATCVEALAAAGVTTAAQMKHVASSRKSVSLIRAFASLSRVRPEEVSHFASVVLSIGAYRPSTLDEYPELVQDANIRTVLRL